LLVSPVNGALAVQVFTIGAATNQRVASRRDLIGQAEG
jgi:hypothetical protein